MREVAWLSLDRTRFDKAFCGAQLKRQDAHAVIAQELAELASKAHLDLLFIKTIRPYPYAGSDIDVILSSDSEFRRFVEMLGASGTAFLAKSDREVTFETKLNEELCLVDVHNDISAAGMVYFSISVFSGESGHGQCARSRRAYPLA